MENKNIPKTKNDSEKKGSVLKFLLIIICAVIIVLIITVVLRRHLVSVIKISGSSMEPTIQQSESWIIDRREAVFERNDIITYHADENSKNAVVSRVIAVAGDTVYIDFAKGDVYINGEIIDEPYIKEKTRIGGKYITEIQESGKYSISEPITINDGYVFVMGDNRNNSRDSREFGPVPVSRIFGVVVRKVR